MGAELQMKSRVGQGSTFWFEVPLPSSECHVRSIREQTRRIAGYKGLRLKALRKEKLES
jgi:hypothetical protein